MKATGGGSKAWRRNLLIALGLALVGLTLGVSSASALTLGVGWTGEPPLIGSEMVEVGKSGAEHFRVPLPPANNNDGVIEAAARSGVTVVAEVSPGGALPTGSARAAFISNVFTEVQRYGYNGQFWAENAGLPYRPITTWEVYNEPNNNGIGPVEYGIFLNEVAAAIQSASQTEAGRGTEVLSGGLLAWGNRGGTTGNWQARGPATYQGALQYLEEAYVYFGGAGSSVTGVAIHPYEIEPASFQPGLSRIQAFEYAVNGFRNKLAALSSPMSLSITESGWPAEGEYSVGATEQANLLRQAVTFARNNGVGEFDWYNLRDAGESAIWQNRSGLLARNGTPRPSWSTFQELSGGARPIFPADGHPVSMRDAVTNNFWIYYRGSEGFMRELYRDPTTGNWFNNKVPAIEAAATGSSPIIGRNTTSNAQWIYYQGADDYIWELFRNPTSGEWANNKVPALEPEAAGTSPMMLGDPSVGQAWIYYQGADGNIWELYRNPTTGEWANNKVPAQEQAATGTTPVISRDATSNAMWIYYQGADGYIWELYRNPTSGEWANNKVPAVRPAAPGSSPTMLSDTVGPTWIYYRGSDGYIWELYRNPTTGEWANNKVPAIEPAGGGTTPVIGRNTTSNAMWIYYQGANGNIWELYRNPTSGEWANTQIPNAQPAAPGTSPTMLGDPSTGEAWIEYWGSDGYMWELWRNPSTGVWANGQFPTAQR